MIFLKLGGSLITDKTQVETVRHDVLQRLAAEIRGALDGDRTLKLVLGHGSGSFGHIAAAKHGTRQGVETAEQWLGFVEVSRAAAQLDQIVVSALLGAGVPVMSIRPSALVMCEDGAITQILTDTIAHALQAGLVPMVMGDVAFDTVRGGTIVSTEEVMMGLADALNPSHLLLAGETDGVYDTEKNVIPMLTAANLAQYRPALGGSRGTDVTGGMSSKVEGMLALCERFNVRVRIFSGLRPGVLRDTLLGAAEHGTMIA